MTDRPSEATARGAVRAYRILIGVAGGLLLGSCGGSSHPRPVSDTAAIPMPRTLELYSEVHVATLHFPGGSYLLSAADRIGYYYRAPGGVIEHTALGPVPRDGGIFVSKRNRAKLRGYVYLAGGVTHVGNFSDAQHRFRD